MKILIFAKSSVYMKNFSAKCLQMLTSTLHYYSCLFFVYKVFVFVGTITRSK